eukprot:scaffold5558_cov138-Skeletonema_menzelii.AAC.8
MAKTKGAVDTKKRKKRRVLSAAEEAERHRKSQARKKPIDERRIELDLSRNSSAEAIHKLQLVRR